LTKIAQLDMQFDLFDIRLFVNISETASMTHGAMQSHISLPSASTRIKNIEDRLGVKLLYRASNGVTLTPAGQAFLHHGRLVLQQLETLRADWQEYALGVKGHLHILANTTAITEFLPAVLRKYLASHPDVNIDLRECVSQDIVRAVGEGRTDIGIVAGDVHTEGLEILPYRRDRLVLATARNHPLARRKDINFTETLDFDYVGLAEASAIAIHTFLNHFSGLAGKQIKLRIEVRNFEAMCRMIEANIGIGVLPQSAARRHAQKMAIRIIQLTDDWAARNLRICLRKFELLPSFARELVELLIIDGRARSH
jgi:DNA-binding transcriptional LysR family regulator